MKKPGWRFHLGIVLFGLTVVLMGVHYLIFHDAYNLAFYGLLTLVTLPAQALFLTLILDAQLERRSRQEMLEKLNMVIGVFFSEVGTELLRRIAALDETRELRENTRVDGTWDTARYAAARAYVAHREFDVRPTADDLAELRAFLTREQGFVLNLLQNPNLLEHESFTDMLWAVSHLAEELRMRTSLEDAPESDRKHLAADTARVYGTLTREWLDHAQYLQAAYPYLFSLTVRTNPLDPAASVVVQTK